MTNGELCNRCSEYKSELKALKEELEITLELLEKFIL